MLGIVWAVARNLAARAQASEGTGTLLDIAGLAAVTYGAWTWHHAAGWVIGGIALMILSARLGT